MRVPINPACPRLVQHGARFLDSNPDIAKRVHETQAAIERRADIAELILVESGGALIVVEGHTRATAFVLDDRPFPAFVERRRE